MLRKLLALFVLVTGLATLAQPAQALTIGVENVRSSLDAGYACAPQQRQASEPGARVQRNEVEPRSCPRPPRVVLIVPTVMLQADRARE